MGFKLGKKDTEKDDSGRSMDKEEIDRTLRLVTEIGTNEKNGFFVVIQLNKLDEETTEADGAAKVTNCNKSMILKTVLAALDISEEEIMLYLMKNTIGGMDDDD